MKKLLTTFLTLIFSVGVISCSDSDGASDAELSREHLESGKQLFKDSLYGDALDEFKEAIEYDSNNVEAYVGVYAAINARDSLTFYFDGIIDSGKAPNYLQCGIEKKNEIYQSLKYLDSLSKKYEARLSSGQIDSSESSFDVFRMAIGLEFSWASVSDTNKDGVIDSKDEIDIDIDSLINDTLNDGYVGNLFGGNGPFVVPEDTALLFYKIGDSFDNDGDGCIDEELNDSIDNDFDGFIDEDMRFSDSSSNEDGVDNDADGLVDEADENDYSSENDKSIQFTQTWGLNSTGDKNSQNLKIKFDVLVDTLGVQYNLEERIEIIGGCWKNYTSERFDIFLERNR